MKRSDLSRSVQVQFKRMRSVDADDMLDAIIGAIIEGVAAGDRVEIRGFGTFQPRPRAAKDGYDPRTGGRLNLAPGRTILFRPSPELTKKMTES